MTKKIIPVLLALLIVSSCSTHRAVLNENKREREPEYSYNNQFNPFFAHGIFQTQKVDLESVCGSSDKVHSFLVKETFVDVLLKGVTAGIYSPRTTRVYCEENSNQK